MTCFVGPSGYESSLSSERLAVHWALKQLPIQYEWRSFWSATTYSITFQLTFAVVPFLLLPFLFVAFSWLNRPFLPSLFLPFSLWLLCLSFCFPSQSVDESTVQCAWVSLFDLLWPLLFWSLYWSRVSFDPSRRTHFPPLLSSIVHCSLLLLLFPFSFPLFLLLFVLRFGRVQVCQVYDGQSFLAFPLCQFKLSWLRQWQPLTVTGLLRQNQAKALTRVFTNGRSVTESISWLVQLICILCAQVTLTITCTWPSNNCFFSLSFSL